MWVTKAFVLFNFFVCFTHLVHAIDLGLKYPYLFQTAAYHVQEPDQKFWLTQYPIHKDKAGKITAFYCVEGWSFNFVAVQSKSTKSKFVVDDNYEIYQKFKQQHIMDDNHSKIVEFEKILLKEAGENSLIRVIWLKKGYVHYF